MNNSRNKVIAGVVCGVIIGSVGTSFIGNFQSTQQNNIANFKDKPQGIIPDETIREEFEGKRLGKHHEGAGSLQTDENIDIASGNYSDGTYEGEASGYGPNLKVQVAVSSGKISDIEVVSHNETPGFYERAFETVPSEIIQKQSTDVDTVSGATYSSVGIINAVNDALKDASTITNTQ
ncbi:FMN-binding protein [Romboutsia sp.]|uniref:FMN-binding protein n=1 Tax=Romboutsia sp. TaxID=1965302 RepID=UPI002C18150A|nr:FMN-binding protein [Romboutsia sp.]HSQ87629.1 FMN-binding protein [Romboutsia sp.]